MKASRPMTQTHRATIYCRVSSAGQEDNSSLGSQEAVSRTIISGVAE